MVVGSVVHNARGRLIQLLGRQRQVVVKEAQSGAGQRHVRLLARGHDLGGDGGVRGQCHLLHGPATPHAVMAQTVAALRTRKQRHSRACVRVCVCTCACVRVCVELLPHHPPHGARRAHVRGLRGAGRGCLRRLPSTNTHLLADAGQELCLSLVCVQLLHLPQAFRGVLQCGLQPCQLLFVGLPVSHAATHTRTTARNPQIQPAPTQTPATTLPHCHTVSHTQLRTYTK